MRPACVLFFSVILLAANGKINDGKKEFCTGCQKVLDNSFVNYQSMTSRRVLRHKLKHLCKRYFEPT
ncbi:unnamed protein product [Bursaphelenchus xylophilus]|uniref:(pine wood nematode) hypothetical protein n=1 Tax=Bursaphelenchus xylophilus TaxID=6326 RepID=A0A7I8WVM6_BURXY|nr:unnamed protein product [Bursaphelenchus xylophilus]CAG9117601.1 unnamed protein product [Bursaphelenchus xylophilus]